MDNSLVKITDSSAFTSFVQQHITDRAVVDYVYNDTTDNLWFNVPSNEIWFRLSDRAVLISNRQSIGDAFINDIWNHGGTSTDTSKFGALMIPEKSHYNAITNIGVLYFGGPITCIGTEALSTTNVPHADCIGEYYFPYTLATVGDSALVENDYLESLDLRHTRVQSLGTYALDNCTSLKCLLLPNNFNHLGSYATVDCDSLEYIDFGGNCCGFDSQFDRTWNGSGAQFIIGAILPASTTTGPKFADSVTIDANGLYTGTSKLTIRINRANGFNLQSNSIVANRPITILCPREVLRYSYQKDTVLSGITNIPIEFKPICGSHETADHRHRANKETVQCLYEGLGTTECPYTINYNLLRKEGAMSGSTSIIGSSFSGRITDDIETNAFLYISNVKTNYANDNTTVLHANKNFLFYVSGKYFQSLHLNEGYPAAKNDIYLVNLYHRNMVSHIHINDTNHTCTVDQISHNV